MKRGRTFGAAMFSMFLLVGCASAPKQPDKPVYTPTFDYSPPATAATNSAQVTVAIVSPKFPESDWFNYYPYSEFRTNMEKDLIELLNAQGYTVKGPFRTRDEMTYPDKEGSDLILVPDMDMKIMERVAPKDKGILVRYWQLEGTIDTRTLLSLSLMEPLSAEKMWTKNIDLGTQSVKVVSKKGWGNANEVPSRGPGGYAYVFDGDKKVQDALGRSLEGSYKGIMDATWKYLDPKELALVKEQAKKVREKIMFQSK